MWLYDSRFLRITMLKERPQIRTFQYFVAMHYHSISNIMSRPTRCVWFGRLNSAFYHHDNELNDQLLPSEWYKKAYPKLIKLAHALKNVEQIDGRLRNINDRSPITDDRIIRQMQTFNSLAKTFIGSPSMQHALKKNVASASKTMLDTCFSKPSERNSMLLNSLTKVCDFLNISAQKRKHVRLKACPQITQHHIWQGAVEEVIKNLKSEMDTIKCHSQVLQLGQQIVSNCIKFFTDTKNLSHCDSPSWMRPAALKKVDDPLTMRKWEEFVEMSVDLSKYIGQDERLACHVSKIEVMSEGLYQIKDISVERDISYKEVQRQDSLVQKKLSKSLGHSSKCLFTLLLYYLYGSVTDIEVEVCGGVYGTRSRSYACIGKILTSSSSDEEMLWNGVKQLNKALGVFKFVWETAAMDGVLELQGHVWCVGAKERTLKYRGNLFFVHEIRL